MEGALTPSLFLHPPPEIVLPSTYQTHVGGLCGYYDGQRSNEYLKQDGTWTKSLNDFGKSWQVSILRDALGEKTEAGGHPRARSACGARPTRRPQSLSSAKEVAHELAVHGNSVRTLSFFSLSKGVRIQIRKRSLDSRRAAACSNWLT